MEREDSGDLTATQGNGLGWDDPKSPTALVGDRREDRNGGGEEVMEETVLKGAWTGRWDGDAYLWSCRAREVTTSGGCSLGTRTIAGTDNLGGKVQGRRCGWRRGARTGGENSGWSGVGAVGRRRRWGWEGSRRRWEGGRVGGEPSPSWKDS